MKLIYLCIWLTFSYRINLLIESIENIVSRKMNKFLITLFSFLAITAVSCSDDDELKMPTNAISLNMMIGDSETTIGGSDVYVNASNNFTSYNCGIADLGRKGGFNQNPNLSQLAQEVAVTPGNFYQIVLANKVKAVAGVRSIPINTNYYNVYVDSWIYDKDKDITGVKVSYIECYPEIKQLPEWDSQVSGTSQDDGYYNKKVTFTFPKGCNIDKDVDAYFTDGYQNRTDELRIEIKEEQIAISYPLYSSSHKPYVEILVRYESVYTRVSLAFE